MKTLYKSIQIIVGVFLLATIATSCLPEQQSMGSAGSTFVRLTPATEDGFNLIVLDPTTEPQSFLMFDVRRDCANAADLNSTTTVTLQADGADTAMLKAYNAKHDENYVPMGASLYTTVPAMSGGKFTLTFGPGEFAKTIRLTIPNAFNLNLGLKYGFIFKVSVEGTGTWSGTSADTLLTQILPKNKYDGRYSVTANSPMVDIVSPGLTGWYPFTYDLVTTGANTNDCIEVEDDYPLHPISNGGNWSYYGSFCPQVEFAADGSGKLVKMTNYWGNPAPNTRGCLLDSSQDWGWDPATKNIRVKYYMTMPSAVPTPPSIRTTFDETWTYSGPRD